MRQFVLCASSFGDKKRSTLAFSVKIEKGDKRLLSINLQCVRRVFACIIYGLSPLPYNCHQTLPTEMTERLRWNCKLTKSRNIVVVLRKYISSGATSDSSESEFKIASYPGLLRVREKGVVHIACACAKYPGGIAYTTPCYLCTPVHGSSAGQC